MWGEGGVYSNERSAPIGSFNFIISNSMAEKKAQKKKKARNEVAPVGSAPGLNLHYLDEFIKLDCAPNLLAARPMMFPDVKEITESMGLYNAFRRHILPTFQSNPPTGKCAMVVIGDGATPR